MKPKLVERQSVWSYSCLWRKVVTLRHTIYDVFYLKRSASESDIWHTAISRKRTKIVSENLSRYVITMLNGDCLNRNANNGYVLKILNIRQGNGVLIVVRERESRLQGEGGQLTNLVLKLGRCVRHYEKSNEHTKQSVFT